MEDRSIKIKSNKNSKISIKIIPGHFATNHSHINYYIDMTTLKYRSSRAHEAAVELAHRYATTTEVDTIVCMDGCEIIGAFLAQELFQSSNLSMNESKEIAVITPEYNSNSQMIFRDNIQTMIWGKNVLLLLASTTTGKPLHVRWNVLNIMAEIRWGSPLFSVRLRR